MLRLGKLRNCKRNEVTIGAQRISCNAGIGSGNSQDAVCIAIEARQNGCHGHGLNSRKLATLPACLRLPWI